MCASLLKNRVVARRTCPLPAAAAPRRRVRAGEQTLVRGARAAQVPWPRDGRAASAHLRGGGGRLPEDQLARERRRQPVHPRLGRVGRRQDRVGQDHDAVPRHREQERRPEQSGSAGASANRDRVRRRGHSVSSASYAAGRQRGCTLWAQGMRP
eukprot:6195678-Pleurochrysis_carterae.AAC.2